MPDIEYAICIGAQKAGTSFLYQNMIAAAGAVGPRNGKETDHFLRRRPRVLSRALSARPVGERCVRRFTELRDLAHDGVAHP